MPTRPLEPKLMAQRVLIEVLFFGLKNPETQKQGTKLQKQLDSNKIAAKKIRALFYVDNGEKTDDEKKAWLLENCNCKYYVFAPAQIPENYITSLSTKIKNFEKAFKEIMLSGICLKKDIKKEQKYDPFEVVKEDVQE